MNLKKHRLSFAAVTALVLSQSASAACIDGARNVLKQAVDTAASKNTGGYSLNMWLTYVDETGKICEVVSSGTQATGEKAGNAAWLGSRVISAQKAFTANAFSLDGYAISTANLYSAVQPGGSLYGLQHSNPVDSSSAYLGDANSYGTETDPLKGKRIGGINVFGGGLAIYFDGKKVGAIGVSGDTSCRDHAFAWQVRHQLGLEPAGTGITTSNMNAAGASQTALTGATIGDEMIINANGSSTDYWDAWSHPACPNSTGLTAEQNSANGVILN
ncbi:MAG: heme-binding protein [Methylomonas sp.]|nr:heme-binding protein [Methylomonas sp.]